MCEFLSNGRVLPVDGLMSARSMFGFRVGLKLFSDFRRKLYRTLSFNELQSSYKLLDGITSWQILFVLRHESGQPEVLRL